MNSTRPKLQPILRVVALSLQVAIVACGGGSGDLHGDESMGFYDFDYRPAFDEPYAALASGRVLTLQARVEWDGPQGEPITVVQHVPMAFTQATDPHAMKNADGAPIWTHGVGAYVGASGLALEVWGRNGDTTSGTFWSQDNERCPLNTAGADMGTGGCIADSLSPGGYITSAPGFQLKKGVPYILTVYLQETWPGWMTLRAKLYEANDSQLVEVQAGMIGFEKARHFPDAGQPLRAAIARTPGGPGEPSVSYTFLGDVIAFEDKGRRMDVAEIARRVEKGGA